MIASDLSERMLEVARRDWAHPRVTHQRAAMEELDFPAGRFDLVVSSLALHYVEDYASLMARVARVADARRRCWSSRPSTRSTPRAPPRPAGWPTRRRAQRLGDRRVRRRGQA